MPTQITFTSELSRERLLELRQEIDALIGPAPVGAGTSQVEAPRVAAGALDEAAQRLRGRVNPGIQGLVRHLAQRDPSHPFTWEDVSRDIGIHVDTVKSWHRNLSKPVNRLRREYSDTPELLAKEWVNNRYEYSVSPEWREAIRRTW